MILRTTDDNDWLLNPIAKNLERVVEILCDGKIKFDFPNIHDPRLKRVDRFILFSDHLIEVKRTLQELYEAFENEGLVVQEYDEFRWHDDEEMNVRTLISMALCGHEVMRETQNLSFEMLKRFVDYTPMNHANYILCEFCEPDKAYCATDYASITNLVPWRSQEDIHVANNRGRSNSSVKSYHRARQACLAWPSDHYQNPFKPMCDIWRLGFGSCVQTYNGIAQVKLIFPMMVER